MKKAAALLLTIFFLSGCSSADSAMEDGLDLRTKILAAEKCSFSSEITADYWDKVFIFSMDCQCDKQGTLSFCVREPEAISGIRGRVTDEGGNMIFDGTELSFPLMAEDRISPISSPWLFMKTLRTGNIISAGKENDLTHLVIDDSFSDDAIRLDIWLNQQGIPVRAETIWEGQRILTLAIKDFQLS